MKRRHSLPAILAVALGVAVLAGCAPSPSADDAGGGVSAPSVRAEAPSVPADQSIPADQSAEAGPETQSAAVIRTADATVRVDDPEAAAETVAELAAELDGRVESQSVGGGDGSRVTRASLSLRVPAESLDEALERLAEIGTVVARNVSASDVTLERTDLHARVEALQGSVDRLQQLMQEADTTSDLLEAESALSQRQAELDGLRAQLVYLDDQVAYATLWVELQSDEALPGGPANFWEAVVAGVRSIGAFFSGAAVVAGVVAPWLVLVAIPVVVGWWLVRRGRRGARRRGAKDRADAAGTADGSGSPPEA